jgi:hypothetical protein
MAQPLFVAKFKDFKVQWDLNQKRTKGFSAYTRASGEEKKTHVKGQPWKYGDSIDVSALPSLERINALGFFTTDSQIGISNGENRERAYCEGFIPAQLLTPFTENIGKCNNNINVVVYPNDKDPQDVLLTIDNGEEYSHLSVLSEKDLQEYVIPSILNAGKSGSTISYYSGDPVGYIDIKLASWRFITVYDDDFGHNALDTTGLFTCIEQALGKALTEYNPPPTAGVRRRTKKSSRRARKTRRSHK